MQREYKLRLHSISADGDIACRSLGRSLYLCERCCVGSNPQLNRETAALTLRALNRHRSSHRGDKAVDDCEAKASSTSGARARAVDTVEPLEDAIQIFLWNTDAIVGYDDGQLVGACRLQAQRDQTTRWGIGDGIAHQVCKNLDEPLAVGQDWRQPRVGATHEHDLPLLRGQ